MLNSFKTKREARFASLTSSRLDRIEILDELSNSTDVSAYRSAHIDVKDIIIFAAIRIKELYNRLYRSKFFKVGDLVNLRLHREYRVLAIKSKKLSSQFIGLFSIIERIDRLIYRLRL